MIRFAAVAAAMATTALIPPTTAAQEGDPASATEPPPVAKVRNYLPHMTRPEVEDLLTRTDMVIIPVGALEQHGTHLPIGTDHLNGVARAQRVAQRTDVLVAPILLPGQSPYHMGFAGTVTLPSTLIQEVYVEAAKSLIRHGFKRFLMLNAHGGNRAITNFIVDRINQETEGIAVELGAVAGPLMERGPEGDGAGAGAADAGTGAGTDADAGGQTAPVLDRHGGTGETSNSLYLIPELVDLDAAYPAELTMPAHLEAMVPEVLAGDPTALAVFLAEGLKDESTGKGTSSAELSTTGVWGERDPTEATAERGRVTTERFVDAAVRFIERWNALRPPGTG